jgi:SAM-dependent methyltransferase
MNLNLLDIVQREPVPEPWAEGEKIPWDDPAFSQRMLQEHLSDLHDAASRRPATIDRHVDWIHHNVLQGTSARILDLGCGPGLYTSRLAQLGHQCTGIDFSPASIDYARKQAESDRLACSYIQGDVREAEFGPGFDLAMMIFGELNVFRPDDAKSILQKTRESLNDGGTLLLEVHTPEAVEAIGAGSRRWRSSERGLFSKQPHLLLEECFWDDERQVATTRYLVVDAATASVDRYAASVQAYSDADYRTMLVDAGFQVIELVGALDGSDSSGEFVVYVAAAD